MLERRGPNPISSTGEREEYQIEAGKMADVTIWDGSPFSVYTKAQKVYIDGALVYERGNAAVNPVTDFSLGTSAQHGGAQ